MELYTKTLGKRLEEATLNDDTKLLDIKIGERFSFCDREPFTLDWVSITIEPYYELIDLVCRERGVRYPYSKCKRAL